MTQRRRSIVVLVLQLVAGVLLLGSWSVQSLFAPRWSERLAYLEKSQSLIEVRSLRSDLWLANSNAENSRVPRQAGLLASALVNLVRDVNTLVAWERVRLTLGADTRPIEAKNLNLDLAKAAHDLVMPRDGAARSAAIRFVAGDEGEFESQVSAADARGDFAPFQDVIVTGDRGVPADGKRRREALFGLSLLLGMATHASEVKSEYTPRWDAQYLDMLRQSRASASAFGEAIYPLSYLLGSLLLGLQWYLVKVRGWPEKLESPATPNKALLPMR